MGVIKLGLPNLICNHIPNTTGTMDAIGVINIGLPNLICNHLPNTTGTMVAKLNL